MFPSLVTMDGWEDTSSAAAVPWNRERTNVSNNVSSCFILASSEFARAVKGWLELELFATAQCCPSAML
jgi:hypothetical protein